MEKKLIVDSESADPIHLEYLAFLMKNVDQRIGTGIRISRNLILAACASIQILKKDVVHKNKFSAASAYVNGHIENIIDGVCDENYFNSENEWKHTYYDFGVLKVCIIKLVLIYQSNNFKIKNNIKPLKFVKSYNLFNAFFTKN